MPAPGSTLGGPEPSQPLPSVVQHQCFFGGDLRRRPRHGRALVSLGLVPRFWLVLEGNQKKNTLALLGEGSLQKKKQTHLQRFGGLSNLDDLYPEEPTTP